MGLSTIERGLRSYEIQAFTRLSIFHRPLTPIPMSWFQLDPASVAGRARASGRSESILSLSSFLVRGILGFTLLSIAGFAPWAFLGRWFHQTIGEAGLYVTCALIFIGLSGPLLHRLIIGPGSLPRFYKLFSLVFAAYSILWIGGWMTLRGHLGSGVGLLAGTIAMGWMLAEAFDARAAAPKTVAALFILNSLGYFGGGVVEGAVGNLSSVALLGIALSRPTQMIVAKLLWGVCYGIGFGAGLGLAFYICQSKTRALISSGLKSTQQTS